MKRPNVLLLFTDEQRWDTIRAAGNPHIHTPNLDRLAQQGVLFEHAFCNSPVCMPSRQSMLTGQYPSTIGCTANGVELSEDVPTLATVLKPYGYHTANLGKLHFKNHSNRDHREPHPSYGFDHLVMSEEPGCYDDAYIKWVEAQDPSQVENCRYSTPPAWQGTPVVKQPRDTHEPYVFEGPEHLTHSAFVADETIDFLRGHAGGPFFAIAGFFAPHSPVNPPKRFADMYDASELPLPIMNEGEGDLGLPEDEWRRVKAYYYALVSHVDDQVGRILGTIDELGLRDDTIVVFTFDHGDHLGDHGLVHKGPPGYDSCSRVPLLVSWPGTISGGQRTSELIELVDLAPTLLDLCGVQIPPAFQGRSFGGLARGGEYEERSSAFLEYRRSLGASWKAVRTHDLKYCLSNAEEELLFDLRNDPGELTNVVDNPGHRDDVHQMRAELLRRWFTVENQYPLKTASY